MLSFSISILIWVITSLEMQMYKKKLQWECSSATEDNFYESNSAIDF